jgi:lipoprotein-anchoring transpeptidase ErfK/SrfK
MYWRTRMGNKIFVTAIAIASGAVVVEPRPATALDLLGLFGGEETPRAAVAAPGAKPRAATKQKIVREAVTRETDTRERPIRIARKIEKRGSDQPDRLDVGDDDLSGLDPKPWQRVESKSDAKPAVTARRHLPLFVVVALGEQQLTVYNHDGVVTRSQISSGMPGHETPRGIFTILARELMHHSNLYSNAPMPFMQRVTWSGVAMHTGVVPGHPASHGCVRLPASFAPRLWGLTRIGERVVISHENVQPEPISHAWLPVPKLRPAPGDLPEKGKVIDGKVIAAPAVAPKPSTDPTATNAPAPTMTPRAPDDSTRQTSTGGAIAPATNAATPRTISLTTPSFISSAEAAPLPAPATSNSPINASAPAPGDAPAAAPQKLLNPREYAEELKKKTVADLAAARKQVRDLSATLDVKRNEFARVGAVQRAAENALAAAQTRIDLATQRLEKAVADVEAKKQEAANPLEASSPAVAAARAARLAQQTQAALQEKYAAVEAKLDAEYALPELKAKLEAAQKAPAALDAEISELARRMVEAEAMAEAATKAEKMARLRTEAVSVLISRKDKKIYVRQGLVPVFDAPVTITDPDAPLGTHLFIATAPGDDGKSLQWTVLSPPTDGQRSAPGPSAALDRIELAQDVRDRLSELFWTGGSIIVSDQPPSSETGADGTDLTVRAR